VLPAVLLFLAIAFGMWVVLFRSSGSILRVEQARVLRASRTQWSAPAMATALRLIETGTPPVDPYDCKLALTQDGVTKYFHITFEQLAPTQYRVQVVPTTSDDAAIDCPSSF
jgi:hypothetical protein